MINKISLTEIIWLTNDLVIYTLQSYAKKHK